MNNKSISCAPRPLSPEACIRSGAGLQAVAERFPAKAEVHTEAIAERDSGTAIAKWAEDNDVDLIVISTHGRTGFRRLTLGSVAEAVLRHSETPVICFPMRD